MVDGCRIWERHCETEIQPRTSAERHPVRVTCQVTEVEPTPAVSPETETVVDIITKLLPTPAPPAIRFRRGVLFVWGIDPYDGPMPDYRRVVSVFAYRMAGGTHRRQVLSGTGSPTKPPGPTDGKRRLIRGEGLVARISNDYRPQLPVVGKDIPEPAVPYHVGTARLEETEYSDEISGACCSPPLFRFGGVR